MTESISPSTATSLGTDQGRSPSEQVVYDVADAEGVDPLDLESLQETIDCDALDELVTRASNTLFVRFDYMGYRVFVDGSDGVTLIRLKSIHE